MGPDLVVSFWEQLFPKLQKYIKSMIKAVEKALEHGTAVARAVFEGFQDQEQLIRKRDAKLQALMEAIEREDDDDAVEVRCFFHIDATNENEFCERV